MWELRSRGAAFLWEIVFLIRPKSEPFSGLFLLWGVAIALSQHPLQRSLADRCWSQRGRETPPTERAALQLLPAIPAGLPRPRVRGAAGERGREGTGVAPSANGSRVPGTVPAAAAWGGDTGRPAPPAIPGGCPGAEPPGSAALPWCPRRPGSPGGSRRTGRGS